MRRRKLRDAEKTIEKAIQDNRKNFAHVRGEYDFLGEIDELMNASAFLSQSTNTANAAGAQAAEEKKEPMQDIVPKEGKTEEKKKEAAPAEGEQATKRRKTEVDIEALLADKEVEFDYSPDELAKLVPLQKPIKYQMAILGTALEQLQGNLSFINDYRVKV